MDAIRILNDSSPLRSRKMLVDVSFQRVNL